MTRAVMVRIRASSGVPQMLHATRVRTAAPSANQKSQPAARSARRWACDDEA
ncbi:hypothetical protein D3C74_474270 [compost metagenome]